MSDILCRWLNDELQLSQAVVLETFAKHFSNGYLIGEVLHKYQQQNDFSMFTNKDNSICKLNNFTRLEPTLKLLGIPFNINTAQELMEEKKGAATHLLHQLYVTLEKTKKAQISKTMIEMMQPAACVALHKKEHDIYTDQLHRMVKRDADLKLQKVCQQQNSRYAVIQPIQQKRQFKVQDVQAMKNIVKIPKPPPYTSSLNPKRQQYLQLQRAKQAQRVQNEIAQFEANRKKLVTYGFASSSSGQRLPDSSQGCDVPGSGAKMTLQSNTKFLQDIQQSLKDRNQREKRVDKFLLEQFKAREAEEEAQREELLVKRLTRQTQQEQRLAAQLLQIRHQKEVIKENRLFREQQYQQRRERDHQETLEWEAALARETCELRSGDIKQELEFVSRIAIERVQSRYKKHFEICKDVLEQIVDLATKVGEYRLLNAGNLIPEKQMREWKELLFSGMPLYETNNGQQQGFELAAPLDPIELKKQEILNNQEYDNYTNMVGEWAWPEEAGEAKLPPTNNNILGHVVVRLRNILHPIVEPSSPSPLPQFALKACVLGKFCSGKSTCLAKIAEAHGVYVFSALTLIKKALDAYQSEKQVTKQRNEQLLSPTTPLKPDLDSQEESRDAHIRLSAWALKGAAAEKELRKGKAIPNELLVDIIVEAIREVPAQSGWILDGFPLDITQAHLLEQALGGCVDVGNAVVSNGTNLVADPNPPKPPPPPAPVLDLAVLLDIPDECVVKYAYSHTGTDVHTKSVFTDSCGSDAAAATSQFTDKPLFLAQIPHRIAAFQNTWPELEEWFGAKQNILVCVEADVDEDEVYRRVDSVLQKVVRQTLEAPVSPPVEDVELNIAETPDFSSATSPPVGEPSLATESHSTLNKEVTREHSMMATTPSVTNEDSQGVVNDRPESTSPCPGSSSWVYVDEPIPPEVAEVLYSLWDTLCDSYVTNIKTVLQLLRSQQTVINHHLYNIREKYKHGLKHPDVKHVFVSEWQKHFNNVPDAMRKNEEMATELRLGLDELCERLWDITDKRKEYGQEKVKVFEGWLEDHTTVLINNYATLMQMELDRFHATLCILKIYYSSMNSGLVPELPANVICEPILSTPGIQEQNESSNTSQHKDMNIIPRSIDAEKVPDADKSQAELIKPLHEKLISSYEDAVTAINNLVSGEVHQGEAEKQSEVPQEKEKAKEPANVNRKKSGKLKKTESKKQKASPAPSPAPKAAPTAEENAVGSHDDKIKNKMHTEYLAAIDHEENAAKTRIALVKGCGLQMAKSLAGRAEQSSSNMQNLLDQQYLAEMKSIEQLSEVVHHHIEAGTKLKYSLVLEGTAFYLIGDCPKSAGVPPIESTPPITQLESLHQKLYTAAPSGVMSCSEFLSLLREVPSVNKGRSTLSEPWFNENETQAEYTSLEDFPFCPKLMEITRLLKEEGDVIDWRRFLLSVALPWPFPSLAQLLVVLQRLKAADISHSGYIDEEQYLQTELWFSKESDQPVTDDPTEPEPYDRLTKLRQLFFKLFADHSASPPRLDYVSMLQYFAADCDPRQGFIRALSVVLGQHLKHSSSENLVMSLPSIQDAAELGSSGLHEECKEEECASSASLGDHTVSIPALLAVMCHKVTKMKDGSHIPSVCPSQQKQTADLVHIFAALGYKPEDCVPFSVLSEHPSIQHLMETSTHYQLVNIHSELPTCEDESDTDSSTASQTPLLVSK